MAVERNSVGASATTEIRGAVPGSCAVVCVVLRDWENGSDEYGIRSTTTKALGGTQLAQPCIEMATSLQTPWVPWPLPPVKEHIRVEVNLNSAWTVNCEELLYLYLPSPSSSPTSSTSLHIAVLLFIRVYIHFRDGFANSRMHDSLKFGAPIVNPQINVDLIPRCFVLLGGSRSLGLDKSHIAPPSIDFNSSNESKHPAHLRVLPLEAKTYIKRGENSKLRRGERYLKACTLTSANATPLTVLLTVPRALEIAAEYEYGSTNVERRAQPAGAAETRLKEFERKESEVPGRAAVRDVLELIRDEMDPELGVFKDAYGRLLAVVEGLGITDAACVAAGSRIEISPELRWDCDIVPSVQRQQQLEWGGTLPHVGIILSRLMGRLVSAEINGWRALLAAGVALSVSVLVVAVWVLLESKA
ncbi:hypothetical protein B0H17DRAFT_1141322 [Mycena rosella]|uniref:Uncharacterized protein n=1 Tax=Mycena rosella TaxID=1033263 RepID=A0AAD7GAC2_MYCRO|nr:hypothetical protein B0H17DRAFT_1141322 [Mycena rosella]